MTLLMLVVIEEIWILKYICVYINNDKYNLTSSS